MYRPQQNLYIRVVNGVPFEHPFVEDNLRQTIKNFDPNNLPEGLEKFIRHPYPEVGFLETFVGTTYKRIDGVIQDYHEVRPLTEEEKQAKIKFAKDSFIYSESWKLNEETGEWIPPAAYPSDGKTYTWNEEKSMWIDVDKNKYTEEQSKELLGTIKELQEDLGISDSAFELIKDSVDSMTIQK